MSFQEIFFVWLVQEEDKPRGDWAFAFSFS